MFENIKGFFKSGSVAHDELKQSLLKDSSKDSESPSHVSKTNPSSRLDAKAGINGKTSPIEVAFWPLTSTSKTHLKNLDWLKVRDEFITSCEEIVRNKEISITKYEGHVGEAFVKLINTLKIKDGYLNRIHLTAFSESLKIINGFAYDDSKTTTINLLIQNAFKVGLEVQELKDIAISLAKSILALQNPKNIVSYLGNLAVAVKCSSGLKPNEISNVMDEIKSLVEGTKDKKLVFAYREELKKNY